MSDACAHYLFGELARFNTTRIWPSDCTGLKAWLDGWLPQSVQAADEAEPDFAAARRLCDRWQRDDRRGEVGVISLPLTPAHRAGAEPYAHLICRVYFNWASAGRVSRTGHAVLLTEAAWRGLDYNPFTLPHLVENASPFGAPDSLAFPEPVPVATTAERLVELCRRDVRQADAWSSVLEQIWAGRLPVTVDPNAPQWVYELVLLSLPREQRRDTSCISGPFGVKRRLSGAIHIRRRGADEPPAEPASAGRTPVPCLAALDRGEGVQGCWQVAPLTGPEHDILALAVGDDCEHRPEAAPAAAADQLAQPRRWPRLLLAGALLMGVGAGVVWLGYTVWAGGQVGDRAAALAADCADGAKRRGETITLLTRADDLLALAPAADDRDALDACIDNLLSLIQARRAEINALPMTGEDDVRRVHDLIAQLSALDRLPLAMGGAAAQASETDTRGLYRRSADWIRAVPGAAAQRARLDFVQGDAADRGLDPDPYLGQVAADVRALEQQEALRGLKDLVFAAGPFDSSRLTEARALLDAFRNDYPDAPPSELAEIAGEMAARFEYTIRPSLLRAYQRLQQQPNEETMADLVQAADDYETAFQAGEGLATGIGVDAAALIARIRDGRIVKIRARTQSRPHRNVGIGLLQPPDTCRRVSGGFGLFSDDTLCIDVPAMRTPAPMDSEQAEQGVMGRGWDLLRGPLRGEDDRERHRCKVQLQEVLRRPGQRWCEGRLLLDAEVQWPRPDEFTR